MKTELDTASRSHLDECGLCRNKLSWMQTAASLGAQEPAYEPPQAILNKVLEMGRGPSGLKRLRNFLVASLTFDSFKDLALEGVRGKAVVSRQMTFEVDDVEIVLWLRPSEERTWTLTGQVLSKSSGPIQDTSAHVDLVVEGDHVETSLLSAWGEFSFPDLPKTQCGLHVSFLDRVLRIPSIPIIDDEPR